MIIIIVIIIIIAIIIIIRYLVVNFHPLQSITHSQRAFNILCAKYELMEQGLKELKQFTKLMKYSFPSFQTSV